MSAKKQFLSKQKQTTANNTKTSFIPWEWWGDRFRDELSTPQSPFPLVPSYGSFEWQGSSLFPLPPFRAVCSAWIVLLES